MSERITCPQCDFEFELSDALTNELRKKIEKEFAVTRKQKEAELHAREAQLQKQHEALEEAQKHAEAEFAKRLQDEREKLKTALAKEAQEGLAVEMQSLQSELSSAREKLKQSQTHELTLRKEQRELEEQREQLQLEIARKESDLRKKLEADIAKRLSEEQELKLADKNNLINALKAQIDDLKKRSEQGSQQAQGEGLETALENQLRSQFPFDTISPVPKGMSGADVVQEVHDTAGISAGKIIWESKRTKHWSNDWLPKLRDNQRSASAELAVLVSQELPKEVGLFGMIDNVWVCSLPSALPLAAALRETLIRTAQARRTGEGQHGKMEQLYNYLAGPQFKQRLEGIAETFHSLRDDLEREKRAIQKIWAKREKQLERAVVSASGLHGDLHGIIGASLEEIEYFALEAIANDEPEQEQK